MSFDDMILYWYHILAQEAGVFFTPFFRFVTLLGEHGIAMLLLGVVLICIKGKRKAGISVILAVALGFLFTNLMLKNLIARPRPYWDIQSDFYLWWQFVGAVRENSFSFPSGHTTTVMSAMTALFFYIKGKYRWLLFVPVLLVGMSRNYLMVHYPTDIIGGIIVGALAGFWAYKIVRNIYEHRNQTI